MKMCSGCSGSAAISLDRRAEVGQTGDGGTQRRIEDTQAQQVGLAAQAGQRV